MKENPALHTTHSCQILDELSIFVSSGKLVGLTTVSRLSGVEKPRDDAEDDNSSSGSTTNSIKPDKPTPSSEKSDSGDKPIIKVKSFAIVPEEESKTPAKPLMDRVSQELTKIKMKPIKSESEGSDPSLYSAWPYFDAHKFVVPTMTAKTTISYFEPTTPIGSGVTIINKVNKDYTSGAFLVLRTEASNPDPPLWKIDGKALLQKYNPFTEDGKTLYKNTAEYSGWSLGNKGNYFPVSIIFKQQDKKEHIVALDRIKWDEPEDSGKDE